MPGIIYIPPGKRNRDGNQNKTPGAEYHPFGPVSENDTTKTSLIKEAQTIMQPPATSDFFCIIEVSVFSIGKTICIANGNRRQE